MKVRVFHVRDDSLRDERWAAHAGKSLPMTRYQHVATIEVEDLYQAFELTNNGSGGYAQPNWLSREGVEPVAFSRVRSTSVGDIMETEDGRRHIVQGCGYKLYEEAEAFSE